MIAAETGAGGMARHLMAGSIRAGRAVYTVGKVGAKGSEIPNGSLASQRATRRLGWSSRGPRPSLRVSGTRGELALRCYSRARKPRWGPRQSIEAVLQWRFRPARDKDGRPVAVTANIEVNFRLY